tara:strand:- start:1863 stop:3749 length:1887 start_codon:yes stop_codon:yes gene_type:complete
MERQLMKISRLLTALLIGLGALVGCATALDASEIGAGGMQIVRQSSATRVGQTFELDLQLPGVVTNGDQITVTIHEPVTDELQFLDSAVGKNLGGVLTSISFDVVELNPNPWGLAKIKLPITDSGATGTRIARPGIYPVSIEMRTVNQELIGKISTHLIRVGNTPFEKLRIAIIANLDTPGSSSTGQSASLTDWAEMLDSHLSVPVSLSFHGGSTESDLLDSSLLQFASQNYEIIRNPIVPINEASLLGAGLAAEVSSLLELGSDQLKQFGELAPTTLWVGHERANETQLEVRWARGIREAVVHPVSLSPIPKESPRGTVELVTNSSTMRGLVIDDLAPSQPHDTPSSAAHRVLSHLATIALNDQSKPLITVALGWNGQGPDFADAFLDGVTDLEWLDPLPTSSAVNTPFLVENGQPQQFRVQSRVNSTNRDFSQYRDAVRHLQALRSMVRDEDARDYDQLSDELLLSLSSAVSELEQRDLWKSVVDLVRLQTSLVDIPPDESIQLTSQKASVPFSFQNRASVPLRVELRIISERLTVEDFDDGESTTIVLDPGVTTHRFRLRALGSGSFPISIELHSPNGGLTVGRAQAALRATTPTGVGLGLTVGAAVFLAAWWFIDTRRRKSQRS